MTAVFGCNENAEDIMKTRGAQMTNMQKKIYTPVKVEFNSTPDNMDFSFSACDSYLKILDVNKNVLLFEQGPIIPVGDEFENLFKSRQQTFRKGNRKFTIFFKLIQRLLSKNSNIKLPLKLSFLKITYGLNRISSTQKSKAALVTLP